MIPPVTRVEGEHLIVRRLNLFSELNYMRLVKLIRLEKFYPQINAGDADRTSTDYAD